MGAVWKVPCSLHVIDPFFYLEKEYRCILAAKKAKIYHPYPTPCTFLVVVKSSCFWLSHTSLISLYLFIVEIVLLMNMHDTHKPLDVKQPTILIN